MADWRTRYRPGSFQGLPCLITEVGGTFGRRVAEHELYLGDAHPFQPLGRLPQHLSLSLLLAGDDHVDQADALQDALCADYGTYGAELVHPWRGRLSVVVVGEARRHNTSDRGGETRFEVTFREVAAIRRDPPPDPAGDVARAAGTTRSAAASAAGAGIKAKGFPQYVQDATTGAIRAVHAALAPLRFVQGLDVAVRAFGADVAALITYAETLAQAPAELALGLLGAVDRIGAAGMSARDSLAVYGQLRGLTPRLPRALSAAGRAANANALLVHDVVRVGALYGAAQAAAQVRWLDAAEALAARRALLDELDDLQLRADDALFDALSDLRVAIVALFPADLASAAAVRSVTLPAPLPSAVLAYRFHDDVTRAAEIEERNRVRHPLFVGAGVPVLIAAE